MNDSKATNVHAACIGLKGIIGRKAVVLLGGLAKVLLSVFFIFVIVLWVSECLGAVTELR